MGMKSCHKMGCTSILCDTYIEEVGYLCDSCKKSFEDFYINYYKSSNIKKALVSFMEKGIKELSYEDKQKRINKFNKLFNE